MSEEKFSSCAPSLPMPSTIQPEPLAGTSGSGSSSLPWACASRSRKSTRRADACVGKIAQPAHRRFRSAFAAEIGERDQEMRLQLQRAQRRHQRGFGDAVGKGSRGDLGVDRGKPLGNRRRRTAGRALRAGGGRSRAGNRKGRRRRRESRGPDRLATAAPPAAAGRARRRCERDRPGRARPRRGRAGRADAASTTRPAPCSFFAAAALALMALPLISGNTIETIRPGSAAASSRRPPWNFMTALARLKPRPEPGCERLCSSRTKRSVARWRSASSGMPGPLSATDKRISPDARDSATRTRGFASAPGESLAEYLMALSTMLDSAWPISSRLPVTTKLPATSASSFTPSSSAAGS